MKIEQVGKYKDQGIEKEEAKNRSQTSTAEKADCKKAAQTQKLVFCSKLFTRGLCPYGHIYTVLKNPKNQGLKFSK